MTYDILVTNITVVRSMVFEHYTFIPDSTGAGQDFTGATIAAIMKDKPGGATLATFTCTPNIAPPGTSDTKGWVQTRLDNSTSIAAGYTRGYWYLTVSLDSDNPAVVEAGIANIMSIV